MSINNDNHYFTNIVISLKSPSQLRCSTLCGMKDIIYYNNMNFIIAINTCVQATLIWSSKAYSQSFEWNTEGSDSLPQTTSTKSDGCLGKLHPLFQPQNVPKNGAAYTWLLTVYQK